MIMEAIQPARAPKMIQTTTFIPYINFENSPTAVGEKKLSFHLLIVSETKSKPVREEVIIPHIAQKLYHGIHNLLHPLLMILNSQSLSEKLAFEIKCSGF